MIQAVQPLTLGGTTIITFDVINLDSSDTIIMKFKF